MTKRKLASTISFFARRAFCSPRDTASQISRICWMVRLVCCSIFAKLSKDKRIRSSYFGKRFAQALVDFNAFATHASLLPLAIISASNSSFGIPAISTNTFCS